ncbi:MAG TPA: biotin-dependent carboxyltransferase family protein [Xanthomonadales bacterium]|nr:biotin-dependent carboxyltransferase family protein [Xanthomonadales bacterium]
MLEILRIAPLSSIQDAGRGGWRSLGVPQSGPLDAWSHAVANVLVGNVPDAAALEIGSGRTQIRFAHAAVIALAGARTPVQAGGMSLPLWRPIAVAAGTLLAIDSPLLGARSYLAVAGGFSSEIVLGSRSALMRGEGFPSLLRRGDALPYEPTASLRFPALQVATSPERPRVAPWWADGEPLLDLECQAGLRVIEGSHLHLLQDRRALYTQAFELSPQANRMAAPLRGQRLEIANAGSLISEPVVPGTVQLPPDGLPLILLAEAQTVGGYARIAHVASIDLARLAQRRPGSVIRFEPISIAAAQRLWLWRRERLMRLRIAALARLLEKR